MRNYCNKCNHSHNHSACDRCKPKVITCCNQEERAYCGKTNACVGITKGQDLDDVVERLSIITCNNKENIERQRIKLEEENIDLTGRVEALEQMMYNINFDITGDWNLTRDVNGNVSPVVDEATFRQFLTDGYYGGNDLTSININSFSLINGRLRCSLYANGIELYLAGLDITDVNSVGDISGLTYLDLGSNQIVNFDPTIALPSGLTYLGLSGNQMTTQGYIDSEPWANTQPSFTNPCNVSFNNNPDSITGTNLEQILISKNCIIIA